MYLQLIYFKITKIHLKLTKMDPEKIEVIPDVIENGYTLQLSSENLRGNKEVVIAAVSHNG
jgi:hypothetical protein